MFKVKIDQSNDSIYVSDEKSLLEQLKENNYYVKSSCGGHASCTDCVIKITSGKENVNGPTEEELKLLGNVFHITKERLACQVIVSGEVTIDVSAHDKKKDEKNLQTKTRKNAPTRIRKPQEVEAIVSERRLQAKERFEKKQDKSWEKHWENEGVKVEKRLGGGKRPKGIKDLELEAQRNKK